MTRGDAIKFHEQALAALRGEPDPALPRDYPGSMEAHFHAVDRDRNTIPLWPYETDVLPTPHIRELVGPVGYRYLMAGLAEHYWLIRLTCGLHPAHRVLDVGCGFGKTAIALMRYLRPPGVYRGFDIQPRLVAFTEKMFRQLKVDGHFKADCFPIVGNPYYAGAKGGGIPPDLFTFPYPEREFDTVVSFSVFTHLRTGALANYARNLGRVVRPGGRMLLSFYLLDNAPVGPAGGWKPSTRRTSLVESPDPADRGILRVLNPKVPEYLVAYRVAHVLKVFREAGFGMVGQPLYGSWSGRPDYNGHQDYIVFQRAG